MSERTVLIAGNWKMNLNQEESVNLVRAIAEGLNGLDDVEVLVAPPFTNIPAVKEAIGMAPIFVSAQNMHWEESGAFTGEISAKMLLEAGCSHVILGHSERRTLFNETDEMIDRKAEAASEAGLIPIICIGETIQERDSGKTFDIIREQLSGSLNNYKGKGRVPDSTILAYEPVWAIGTGLTATPEQAQEVHQFIRHWLKNEFDQGSAEKIRILYGGSVKPDNATDLMSKPDIDGALVGGASMKADSFMGIIKF